MDRWFTVQELLGLNGLPATDRGIMKKAEREQWQKRQREGQRGRTFEYYFDSLPRETKVQIKLKEAKSLKEQTQALTAQEKSETYLSEALWQPYERASQKSKEKAQQKCYAVMAVNDLTRIGTPLMKALQLVAKTHNVPQGSLKNWVYKTKQFDRKDWLAVLLSRSGTNREVQYAEMEAEAWDTFLADYLRPEKPTLAACFLRLSLSAKEMGWKIPSQHSIERKLKREVPPEVQIYLREGENALFQLYPAMRRSVADLQAMEWLNGDGYQHNVFVQWHNGEIVRPKTWIWQDVRTRRILGYRCDISENSDSIRYALMDVIEKYGIPREITIDNTRAAANKWLTGGVPNRYRFKVKPDDPKGIIPMLDIKLHWTSVIAGKGHGQAKPIERAFSHGGLGELVDKHPSLAGFYAGANVLDKPDNYNGGKQGVSVEVFLQTLEEGIAMWNAREKRKGELTQGIFSYDQIWQRDYAKANVRRATPEQIRQLMLMSEKRTINHKGEFDLEAGGKLFGRTNIYWSPTLLAMAKQSIVVRFDPEKLHENVLVYSLEGKFLCEAHCVLDAGFGDKSAAREHHKHRTQYAKAAKAQAKALELMEAQETAQFLPDVAEETPIEPASIEYYITEGSMARQAVVVEALDEDEQSEFEALFQKGVGKVKAQQG